MEFRNNLPIFRQIGDSLCDRILSGEFPEGEKLPSVRDLAVELEVNPNTVVRTYQYLQEMNIVMQKRGMGMFTAEGAQKIIKDNRKDEFIREELPRFFRIMASLELELTDLQKYYNLYLEKGVCL
ncbi:GntR family transcriptional regulator [Myxococcota bacterium]|nr:GntR family transcriptional regulator [Myxococcota bacterium]MBU1383014.1 GntR family transcriptional regulator [Myxococcota bacterium]MBU1495779.1 GntR family transcriptional regulator [Myxococcota bacterium]